MSLTNEEFLAYIREALGTTGRGKLFVPFASPAAANEVVFTGFGIRASGGAFATGWQLDIGAASQARQVRAFSTGTVYYVPGPLGQDPRLILKNADILGDLVRRDTLPNWFPLPRYVIYRGLDPASIEGRMRDYFAGNEWLRITLQRQGHQPIFNFEQDFMAGALPPVPVPAGEVLGEAATSAPGRRAMRISMQAELDNADQLYLDPAIYHLHWQEFFDDLTGHTLKDDLVRPFAGPVANGTVRYVSENGGDNEPYDTPADAADSIQDAVDTAQPYDSVVILDTATYDEGDEIEITKPLTLTSLGAGNVTATTAVAFPTLDGDDDNRVVSVHDVGGVVSVTDLIVTGGEVGVYSGNNADPARAGAGIAIERAHATYIRNCYIHDNETLGGRGKHGYGGGIFAGNSSVYIFRNRISNNRANERGGGIGIWGLGWPVIEGNKILNNEAVGAERGDGGGIAAVIGLDNDLNSGEQFDPQNWNAPQLRAAARANRVRIIRNEIAHNTTGDDAGGVYLSALTYAEFLGNEIHHNSCIEAGGGVKATMASDVIMVGDHIHHNRARRQGTGGGGIAIRNSNLTLRNVVIEDNVGEGIEGGGLFVLSTQFSNTVSMGLPSPWSVVLTQVFGATSYFVRIESGSGFIRQNRSERATGQPDDRRYGGGLYVRRDDLSTADDPQRIGAPIEIVIEDIGRVTGNTLVPVLTPPRPAADLFIEDDVHRLNSPINDDNKANFLNGTRFRYNSP